MAASKNNLQTRVTELEAAQDWLLAVLHQMPLLTFVWDEEGRYQDVFASEDHLLYESVHALRGQLMEDVLPPKAATSFLKLVKEALEQPGSHSLEYTLPTPKGVRRFEGICRDMGVRVNGKRCVVFVSQDITARRRVEETTQTLHQLTERINQATSDQDLFQILINALNQGDLSGAHLYSIRNTNHHPPFEARLSFTWQADPELVLPNELAQGHSYSLPETDFIQGWLEMEPSVQLLNDITLLPDSLQSHLETLEAQSVAALCLKQGHQWLGLLLFYWKDEHRFSIVERAIFQALPSLLSPTLASRRLLNRLEEMVAERTQSLREREAQYRLFIEETDDIITHSDAEGKLVYFNPTAAKLWGVSLAEMKGKNFITLVHPEDRDRTIAMLAEWTAQQKSSVTYENRTVHQETGATYHMQWTINLSYNEGGDFVAARSIARNITAKKQAEAKKAQQQEELIQAQQEAIQELSTPIIPVMDQIIVLPLVGNLDTVRARNLMRVMLKGISEHRAKIVILDITGVTNVDTHVVAHLDKTIQAARLKGARPIITGISDPVAEAIIDLGINWQSVETLRNLQNGLMAGLNSLGQTLTELDD